MIAGLSVALAQGSTPESFDGLRAQLEQGVAARNAFCEQAVALAPPAEPGTGDALIDVLGGAIDRATNPSQAGREARMAPR